VPLPFSATAIRYGPLHPVVSRIARGLSKGDAIMWTKEEDDEFDDDEDFDDDDDDDDDGDDDDDDDDEEWNADE
jgi:hypothetical protein